MHFCYIDEAGDSQAIFNATENIQPLLVITGVFIDGSKVKPLTEEFIQLKSKYFPGKFSSTRHSLDILVSEIKGSDIRDTIKKNAPEKPITKHRFRFLDEIIALLEKNNAKIVSRIWVKDFGKPLTDKSVYTLSAQQICMRFQSYLQDSNAEGAVIADFRDPARNSYVAHSIFTQKHRKKAPGDAYPNITETSTFGISNNHACLQITDFLCSSLIFPMAAQAFCHGVITNTFIHPNFEEIRKRYSKRLRRLQFNCKENGEMRWGITVHDPHNHRDGKALFI